MSDPYRCRRFIRRPIAGCRSVIGVLVLLHGLAAFGDDSSWWPAYRHNVYRTNQVSESPQFPLQLAWHHRMKQPPSPAWSPPHFIMLNRLDFDYAPHPVADQGVVCVGSSTDDCVYGLDFQTGRQLWRFTTGGPVRIAPQIANGRVYFGSDDGFAYCLNLADASLVWKIRGAPSDECLIGNGRMMSRWPVRTGVLVADNVAYFAAGMWASEGVYVYAVDAVTGKRIWCNDTAGYAGVNYNKLLTPENAHELRHGVHDGDFGVYGLTPQGPLAIAGSTLLVPNGYNSPAGIDRRTGKVLYANPRPGQGGAWLVGGKDESFHVFYRHRNNYIIVMKNNALTGERLSMQYRGVRNLSMLPDRRGKDVPHEAGKTNVVMRDGRVVSRNAYGMVLAGDVLVMGMDGYVKAVDVESDQEIWRAEVAGKAFEIAVVQGGILVSTDQGSVYRFGSNGKGLRGDVKGTDPVAVAEAIESSAGDRLSVIGDIVKQLDEHKIKAGFALMLGDSTGVLSRSLAKESRLHMINSVADPDDAQVLRTKLLDSGFWYGSRIHVPHLSGDDGLPFAQYFANAIIVNDDSDIVPDELFRMLRPCGGVLMFIGDSRNAFERVRNALASRLQSGELRVAEEGSRFSMLIRGQLPNTLDWNTNLITDQRARWPLRPLWFGGPTTSQVTNYKNENARPPAAFGRYFVLGENTLTAIDAYNGTELWSRPIPRRSPDLRLIDGLLQFTELVWSRELRDTNRRSVRANDQLVYLYLGEGTFHGESKGCVVLDAATGDQTGLYGPYQKPESVQLDQPKSWALKADGATVGTLRLSHDANGLRIELEATDSKLTRLDGWDIYLDPRPFDERYGLVDERVIHHRVIPPTTGKQGEWLQRAAWTSEEWQPIRHRMTLTSTGYQASVTIPWPVMDGSATFGFAAQLNRHNGGDEERIARSFIPDRLVTPRVNNGWINVHLEKNSSKLGDGDRPSVVLGNFESLPKITATRLWPKTIDEEHAARLREHPLTGELGPRIFRTGTGTCGGFDFSATSVIKRSGAAKVLGVYDFAEDAGLHTFVGISGACGASTTTANGLVIASESKARCVCTYAFRTTVALASAERRLNEDWAIFYDRAVDTQVRQAAVNLGAFGDRRDTKDTLWLGFPRPIHASQALGYPKLPGSKTEAFSPGVWPIATSANLHVPIKIECDPQAGPYRFNGDRTVVRGTDRPWLYASGYRGIERLTLKLNHYRPLKTIRMTTSPQLNGVVPESCRDTPAVTLTGTKTQVYLGHNDSGLYIASRLHARLDRRGKHTWIESVTESDGPVWKDHSVEVFLSDATSDRVVHLGLSLSGAAFDALGSRKSDSEDSEWSGDWRHAVNKQYNEAMVEAFIPWTMLKALALDTQTLGINIQANHGGNLSESLTYLGRHGRLSCDNFTPLGIGKPRPVRTRYFDIHLHFAEPDDLGPGDRVFDVSVQQQVEMAGLDIAKLAGGVRKAVVKTASGIAATDSLVIEFRGRTPAHLPILSAFELKEVGKD